MGIWFWVRICIVVVSLVMNSVVDYNSAPNGGIARFLLGVSIALLSFSIGAEVIIAELIK